MTTKEQLVNAIEILRLVAEIIKEKKSIPSGVLYAQLMGFMTLHQYEGIISQLKRIGLVKESGNILYWFEEMP